VEHTCAGMRLNWIVWLDCFLVFACMGQWGRTVIFAQASSSRLGENSRSSHWFLLELSLRRRAFVLSDESSRSGEGVLLKREFVELGGFSG